MKMKVFAFGLIAYLVYGVGFALLCAVFSLWYLFLLLPLWVGVDCWAAYLSDGKSVAQKVLERIKR